VCLMRRRIRAVSPAVRRRGTPGCARESRTGPGALQVFIVIIPGGNIPHAVTRCASAPARARRCRAGMAASPIRPPALFL